MIARSVLPFTLRGFLERGRYWHASPNSGRKHSIPTSSSMGIAFLKEALPGQVLELPATVKRLSINQLAELVLDDTQFTDPLGSEVARCRQGGAPGV